MTATKGNWQRVTRQRPCPICSKGDWCTFIGHDDSPEVVCCMRGESDQPAKNGGWFHRLRDDDDWRRPIRRRAIRMMTDPKPAGIDFDRLAAECQAVTSPEALGRLAADLGLSVESLRRLGVGWSVRHRAWTFPMSDAAGRQGRIVHSLGVGTRRHVACVRRPDRRVGLSWLGYSGSRAAELLRRGQTPM